MHVVIEQTKLAKILDWVESFADPKGVNPIMAHIRLEARAESLLAGGAHEESLAFSAANADTSIHLEVAHRGVLKAGTVTLPAPPGLGQFNPAFTNFGIIGAIDRNLKNPVVQQWSLGLQREFSRDWVGKISYIGAQGQHLQRSRQINPIRPDLVIPAIDASDELARWPQFRSLYAASSAPPTGLSNRIDPRFNSVTRVESSGRSIYHALQVEVSKRLTPANHLQAAYTWGKSIDTGSDVLNVLVGDSVIQQNPFNTDRGERAPSQFDIRHRLVVSHFAEIPWARSRTGLSKKLLDGWSVSGIFQVQSGFPATIYAGPRRGIADLTLTGGGNARANLIGNGLGFTPTPIGSSSVYIPSPCERGVNTMPNTACTNTSGFPLTQPLLGNFGTLGRNTVRLNALRQFDGLVMRSIPLREAQTLQLRAEFYNLFNTPTFGRMVGDLTSPNFGRYTATDNNSRRIQFAVKYIF